MHPPMTTSLALTSLTLDSIAASEPSPDLRQQLSGATKVKRHSESCSPPKQMSDMQECPELWQIPRSLAEPIVDQAVRLFLADMVMPESTKSMTRGHFTSLSCLNGSLPGSAQLSPAVEAVALASLAQRFRDPQIQVEAASRYTTAVYRLRNTDLASSTHRLALVVCIALLSFYEIINAERKSHQQWLHHMNGMMALLKTLVNTAQLPASELALLVLGTEPIRNTQELDNFTFLQFDMSSGMGSLSFILTRVQRLFQDSANIFKPGSIHFEAMLRQYQNRALALRAELLFWSSMQSLHTQPEVVARFTQPYSLRYPGGVNELVCPTLRADSYCDYFTACRWNTYRQCQLHLTNLLHRIRRALSKDPHAYYRHRDYLTARKESLTYIDDVCASIPFLLLGGKLTRSKPTGSIWRQDRPPMLIGGFNLQWLLFTISTLDIVPEDKKVEMKAMLLWIGETLGIGQARVLAELETNPGLSAKGDALRWVGFLI